eukprot:m.33567 g.33567  ORF g.33567 m.33567 type:complete len:175 (+) comp12241_c0_seq1:937-1461(+)
MAMQVESAGVSRITSKLHARHYVAVANYLSDNFTSMYEAHHRFEPEPITEGGVIMREGRAVENDGFKTVRLNSKIHPTTKHGDHAVDAPDNVGYPEVDNGRFLDENATVAVAGQCLEITFKASEGCYWTPGEMELVKTVLLRTLPIGKPAAIEYWEEHPAGDYYVAQPWPSRRR